MRLGSLARGDVPERRARGRGRRAHYHHRYRDVEVLGRRRGDGSGRSTRWTQSRRPRLHPLHVGLDRHAQGRDADARERDQLRRLVLVGIRSDTEDRFSSHAPFHFDLSVLDIYVSLKHGAGALSRRRGSRQEPQGAGGFHRQPSADGVVLDAVDPDAAGTVRRAAGERLLGLADRALRRRGLSGQAPAAHRLAVAGPCYYNLYGPTETNVCTFSQIPASVPEDRAEPYPIGHLCTHCDGLVLDHDGQEVARGEEGLLYIAGPSVFGGYWNRPTENAACFLRSRRPSLVQHRRRRS